MNTLQKRVFLLSSLCFGILVLQFLNLNSTPRIGRRFENLKGVFTDQGHIFDNFIQNFDVDFTMNSMWDHMIHTKSGDFINSTFSAKLPHFLRNKTKRSFKTEKLKVIVVPHSHNDPGYKETYEEYFNKKISNILSLAVEKLFKYHDMTFIWPEACFIETWWNNQTKTTRSKLKHLIKSGRFELTSGAWVIPDEATPHYFAYVDQMIEGHFWIKTHFGVVPEMSYDVDQFSLSSTVRHLMKEAGIKNTVIKRVHLGMKKFLMKEKLMNLKWKDLSGNISQVDLFLHLEPYEWLSYAHSCGPSQSICEDLDLGHKAVLPVPGTKEANSPIRLQFHSYTSLDSFANQVVAQLKIKSSGYLHNVLLLPVGDDFDYSTENEWDRQYKNMKILMQYINSNEKYNVRMDFGTLKEYFTEVRMSSELHGIQYPTVSGDFLPFARSNDYWSGFFTTRPYLKRLGRHLQESVRAADILTALVVLGAEFSEINSSISSVLPTLLVARRILNVFQHHDAITGTSLEKVVQDYINKLSEALLKANSVMAFLAEFIIYGKADKGMTIVIEKEFDDKEYKNGRRLRENSTPLKEEAHSLILYNPYTQERNEIIEIPVNSPQQILSDAKGEHVDFDFLLENGQTKILFEAKLPPLSLTVFNISRSQKYNSGKAITEQSGVDEIAHLLCENDEVNVTFSRHDASPKYMCYKRDNFCSRLNIYWRHYVKSGGAYSLPLDSESKNVLGNEFKLRKLSGSKICVVEVVHKLFKIEYILKNTTGMNGRWLQLNIRTDLSRKNSKDFSGDFAMRIVTSIRNRGTYYTDSNGFYLAKRKFRRNLSFSPNVYPMTSMAVIADGSRVLTVHSTQPNGVFGWEQGVLDIFLDRVALQHEAGLNQRVVDNVPTLSKIFLQFEESMQTAGDEVDMFIPSSVSVAMNDLVQHPVVSLVTTSPLPSIRRTFDFVDKTMPSEMIIANMKCMTNDDFKLEGISMTLHRRLMHNSNKLLRHGGISPHRLFKNLSKKRWKVKEMSLSHLTTKKLLTVGEEVPFNHMDIKTFFLYI